MNGIHSPVEPVVHSFHGSSHSGDYRFSERSHVGIPPSLWMSPASTTPSSPNFPDTPYVPLNQLAIPPHLLPESTTGTSSSPSSYSAYAESSRSTAPTTASSPQLSRKFSDLFTDDLFSARKHSTIDPGSPANFPSPKMSGSPDLKSMDLGDEDVDPEKLAKEDPLATQVWKMYAKTKANLPHGQRMENLTWRMMALALKKKKEDDDRARAEREPDGESAFESAETPSASCRRGEDVREGEGDGAERGRTKGKTKVRVVGFDGTNQDDTEDNECVFLYHSLELTFSVHYVAI